MIHRAHLADAAIPLDWRAATPHTILRAAETISRSPDYNSSASRLAHSLQSAGGAPRICDLLEQAARLWS